MSSFSLISSTTTGLQGVSELHIYTYYPAVRVPPAKYMIQQNKREEGGGGGLHPDSLCISSSTVTVKKENTLIQARGRGCILVLFAHMLAHWKHIHLYSLWPGSNKRNCTNWQKHAILVHRVIPSFPEFAELSSQVFMLLQSHHPKLS
jgi:hypothetical protein